MLNLVKNIISEQLLTEGRKEKDEPPFDPDPKPAKKATLPHPLPENWVLHQK